MTRSPPSTHPEFFGALMNGALSRLRYAAKPGLDGPAVLFHYTTTASFERILRSPGFWASHYSSLNDLTEFTLVNPLLIQYVDQRLAGMGGPWPRSSEPHGESDFQRALLTTLRDLTADGQISGEHAAYVTCLSEHDDVLEQWRAYGDDGHGVALALDSSRLFTSTLERPLDSRWYQLLPVVYDPEAQRGLVRDLVEEFERTTVHDCACVEEFVDRLRVGIRVFTMLWALLAANCKHFSFRAEAEWRISWLLVEPSQLVAFRGQELSAVGSNSVRREFEYLRARPTRSGLVTFAEIPVNWKSVLAGIVLGPCQAAATSIPATALWLEKEGFPGSVWVRRSDIPYRSR